jgi:hypothetical protein
MKRRHTVFIVLLALALALPAAGAFAQAAEGEAATSMTVQVAKAQIRSGPSAIAPVLATLAYREKVVVYGSSGGWARVKAPGSAKIGFVYLSALTEKTIAASGAGAAASGVTETEIALAGKGLSELEEESYRKTANVDYTWVDEMEKHSYSPEALTSFLVGATGN